MDDPKTPTRRAVLRGAAAAVPLLTLPSFSVAAPLPPGALVLPQDDPEPRTRARQLRALQEQYAYSYTRPNIRGIAMCAQPPASEAPRPEWSKKVGEVFAALAQNGAKNDDHSGVERDRAAPAQIARDIEASGDALTVMRMLADNTLYGQTEGQRPSYLGAYAALFRSTPAPGIIGDSHQDAVFAHMRVAGPNPNWLRQINPSDGIPDDFAVKAEHFGGPEGDSLEAALAEGRLFSCEYRELLGISPGSYPVPPGVSGRYQDDPKGWDAAYRAREAAYAEQPVTKLATAPLALFAVPPGGGALRPVAIQLFPSGWQGKDHPVFTPRDGAAWQAAKACVSCADANVHEAVSHLGLTHLVQEAFCLAMHNCLSPRHPLHHLLSPHFEGTLLINNSADLTLVASDNTVDRLMTGTIGDTIRVSAEARQGYHFNDEMFPSRLARRGLDDAELLSVYPYRDDGLLVWAATERWVRSYVQVFYPDDASVGADAELQAFVRQLGQYNARERGRRVGGGVQGVGEGSGGVQTRDYLTKMLTQIIWNGSAQHAAVNFPQVDLMAYVPNMPLSLVGSPPTRADTFTEADFLAMMPNIAVARQQMDMGLLLGGVHHTQLGDYRWQRPELRDIQAAFAADLRDVEQTLIERDRTRRPYPYLHPSRIPQSINI